VTFSVVGFSSDEESWGVAVATRFLAVGAMVPAAEFGVGALATQASTNMGYRAAGLALLRDGLGAKDVVDALVEADDRAQARQLGVVDRTGLAAAWTGEECQPFADSRLGEGYAIQGNLLAGPEVLDAMERAWLAERTGLADRLLATLTAGDAAGGDRRGRQSAAVYVVGPDGIAHGTNVAMDLRVDDAAEPVVELVRLRELQRQLELKP
jgi:uncharacterized Ntn-hydrolase superfamily protein